MSELFRKIDEDFGGSISWNTQPNCRVFDELHTTGLPVLSIVWLMLLQHSATTLGLVEQAFWRVPLFTE